MLKKIPDVLPLLIVIVQPIFILLNLPNSSELEQRMKDAKLPYLCFQDVETLEQHIQSKMKKEHTELIAPTSMADDIGAKLGDCDQIKKIHFKEP